MLRSADKAASPARTESARPTRLATSAAGEYRYEHTKLEPGRTLIWARVRGDLAAWKWVSVAEGATDDVPLTLDPAATGGVTVKAADAAGTVKLLPRDDGPTPAEIPELALAFALPLEAPVAEADRRFVAVPVGKYLAIRVGADGSVRARAPVEVKRGEVVTVELT